MQKAGLQTCFIGANIQIRDLCHVVTDELDNVPLRSFSFDDDNDKQQLNDHSNEFQHIDMETICGAIGLLGVLVN
jgi:hypothetical protein